MTDLLRFAETSNGPHPAIVDLLASLAPERRAPLLQAATSFRPSPRFDDSFDLGPFRAAFAAYWEMTTRTSVPILPLRAALDPPVPIKTVLEFGRLMLTRNQIEIEDALRQIVGHLQKRVRDVSPSPQRQLFESAPAAEKSVVVPDSKLPVGESVPRLKQLVDAGRRYSTVYADPPWAYDNEASRAAAVNHYPTMALNEICAEPVRELVAENAHLHLWTTNGFLDDAFQPAFRGS